MGVRRRIVGCICGRRCAMKNRKPLAINGGREAKRIAPGILEGLAGARTPTQAAQAVSVSLPRYYLLETRAIIGLMNACEPRGKGRQRGPYNEAAALKKDNDRLRQELSRQQSLVR